MDTTFFAYLASYIDGALNAAPTLAVVLIATLVAAAAGAFTALAVIDARGREADDRALLGSVNVTIALLIALLGRLINIKRDQILPALEDAVIAAEQLADSERQDDITLAMTPWVEIDYRLNLPDHTVFARAGRQLDVVQLLTLLDFSLADLGHLIRQRNALIASLSHDADNLDDAAVRHYATLSRDIARLTDENLFFIDKSIEKLRYLAQKTLPRRLHGGIADVGLREDTSPLMPPRDLIKTFE